MAVYVYQASDGELVSWCPGDKDQVADADTLKARGLVAISGLPALDAAHIWDAPTKTVVSIKPLPDPKWIPTFDFVLSFTPDENAAIRASADNAVQHLLFALTLAQEVNLTSPTITNGISYLVSVGILTKDRAATVLAGP